MIIIQFVLYHFCSNQGITFNDIDDIDVDGEVEGVGVADVADAD